ncbi:hypothetical protein E3N86_12335 [Cryobacterium sp. Hz7]|uniref:hypothetical protein n=1 Tax=Cryobacterium sp. Hz7 TaxID=1259166 RepID=UPI0010693542|nr:hypothetical protein [Cryobacterium sp. Hz7]TFB59023.1 hypothetical protein E3N86_12335 [Cryobacterium sp. Hz7]
MTALRMPVSTAARKGISAVAADAAQQRIVLTRMGHDVAVIDSAERLDETVRVLRDTSREVLGAYANLAEARGGQNSLADVCARLGLNETVVRERAVRLQAAQAAQIPTAR